MCKPLIHKIRLLLPILVCTVWLHPVAAQDTTTVMQDTVVVQKGVTNTYDEDSDEEEPPKEHFDSIRAPVSIRELTLPDSAVSRLKNDDAFWYVNQKPVKEKIKPGFWQTDWFKSLMWFLMIGCFISILVWFLASSNIFLFRRKEQPIAGEGEQPEEGDNIFEINFPQEITKAVAARNFNLAIRLYYLQTLKLLSLKNLIHYSQDKTNSEYVSQLHSSAYYKDFFRLTREFEYAWYGQFPISDSMFGAVEEDFKQFIKRI